MNKKAEPKLKQVELCYLESNLSYLNKDELKTEAQHEMRHLYNLIYISVKRDEKMKV